MQRLLWAVLWRVAVEYLWSKTILEEINFHERQEPILFKSKAVSDKLDALLALISFHLFVSFTLDYVYIINWRLQLSLSLYSTAKSLVWLQGTRQS